MTTATATKPRRKTAEVTIINHNPGDRPRRDIFEKFFVVHNADVVTMSEMADQQMNDFDWTGRIGKFWPEHPPGKPDGPPMHIRAHPLFWDRTTMRFVRSGARLLSDKTKVGEAGAGPATLAPSWLLWVTLENIATGRLMTFGNAHTAPSIMLNEKRERLADQQIDGCTKWTRARDRDRILNLTGDFNADWRNRDGELLDPLWNAGYGNPFKQFDIRAGTMKRRQIDYILLRDHPDAKMLDFEVLTRLGFDHKPVKAVERIRAAA